PAALWAFAIQCAWSRRTASAALPSAVGLVGAAVMVGCRIALPIAPGPGSLVENLSGVACAIVALMPWQSKPIVNLARLGPTAFGIYLSHIAFLEGAQAVAARLGYRQLPSLDLAVFLFAAVASLLFTLALMRRKWSWWLIPS